MNCWSVPTLSSPSKSSNRLSLEGVASPLPQGSRLFLRGAWQWPPEAAAARPTSRAHPGERKGAPPPKVHARDTSVIIRHRRGAIANGGVINLRLPGTACGAGSTCGGGGVLDLSPLGRHWPFPPPSSNSCFTRRTRKGSLAPHRRDA